MDQINNNLQTVQNDVIDIRELFFTLKRRKKLILLLSTFITFLALIYIYAAKPVYEAKVVLELAQIDKKPVQEVTDLKQKVETLFEVQNKNIELPKITNINLPKGTSNIITIKAQGHSNNTAQQKLQEVIKYIISLQNKELDSYADIQKKKLDLTKDDITHNTQLAMNIEKDIAHYKEKLLSISKEDAALAGIYAIEIGKKQTEFNNVTSKIYVLKNKKNDLELSISPLRIQKAATIGKIDLQNKPIKPKKALIVIVTFITGLILSVFLAFFLEFLQGIKKED